MVFDREGAEITLGASINKASINRSVNPKMPYLSFLAINYDIPVIVEVQKWFESCIVKNYANPIADRQIMFSDDESYRKRIVRALMMLILMYQVIGMMKKIMNCIRSV
mgnify:FL=1